MTGTTREGQPAPPKVRLPRAQRREQILDSMHGLIRRAGVDAVTMDRVADAAGINKSLLYRFFTNRDDVLAALYVRQSGRLDDLVGDARAGVHGIEPTLRAMVDAYLDWAEEDQGVLEKLDRAEIQGEAHTALRDGRSAEIVLALATVISEEVTISSGDAVLAAALIATSARGLIDLHAATGWDRGQLVDRFVTMQLAALHALEAQG